MTTTIFSITNETENLGYSNSIKALAGENKAGKNINFDMGSFDKVEFENQLKQEIAKSNVVVLTSVGFKDISVIKEVSAKYPNVQIVLTSDKFYANDLEGVKKASLVMPEDAINKYRDTYRMVRFVPYNAELVASPTKADMQARGEDFQKLNPQITGEVSNLLKNKANVMFVGGRVSLPDGSFKENTPKVFEDTANTLIKDGKDAVAVFHGLRSFTKGDKSNDFESVNAFYDTVKKGIKENQKVVLFTKELTPDNKRKSVVKTFEKQNGSVVENNVAINESSFGAADYYFLLNEAVKNGLPLTATVEQMNFIPEALELGAKPDELTPYKWDLSVPSNVATYDKLFKEYNEKGNVLLTQKQAFSKLLKDNEIIQSLLANAHKLR